ncbi:MAG: hypothetical protein ACRESG_04245 [Gammaproteobacteria bacterium]
MNLALTGVASPDPLNKGGNLTYTLTVANQTGDNLGAATQTTMTYALPDGVSYIASNGDASCTTPPAGSSPAPAAATVTCDFSTIDLGTSKTETIAVKVANAGTLTSHFAVTTREPNDGQSALDVSSVVTGTADVSASSSDTTFGVGTTGEVDMTVANAGPDTATNVMFKVSAGGNVKLLSATSTVGTCAPVSGQNAVNCDIGDVAALGTPVSIKISAFGAYTGTVQLQGQATTSANDPDQTNNVTSATVTITGGGGGGGGGSGSGGGALGWLALAALLGLGLAGALARRRRRI